jgi:hypothetical protein
MAQDFHCKFGGYELLSILYYKFTQLVDVIFCVLTLIVNRLVLMINLLFLQFSLKWIGFDFWVGGLRPHKCIEEKWDVLVKYWTTLDFVTKQRHMFICQNMPIKLVQNVSKFDHGGLVQQTTCYVNAHWITWSFQVLACFASI